jgi:CRISPR-associated protein Csb2
MLAIAIRFPAGGRYHATAWGSHANEGVPEWPPSPWRLLRFLIATARWKDNCGTCDELPRLRRLVETLAAAPPPRYVLPTASAAHTRHYMPLGDESTTKVFDTFVHAEAGKDLVILWDAALDASGREYLAVLLAKLNYFGRAESLAEAELLPVGEESESSVNAYPMAPGEPLGEGRQTLKLLAAQSPTDYAAWIAARVSPFGGKLTAKERKALPPADIFAALHLDTDDWRGTGWSQPPGSRWVEYVRPTTPFKLSAPPARHIRRARTGPRPTVARYEIQTPVRESITKALSLGERLHAALWSPSDTSPVFSGQENGQPVSGHEHAFYLPECDHRGLLVRVTVFARMGFDDKAVEALRSLRSTWARHSPGLKLLLIGLGQAAEFGNVSVLGTSTEWVSLTPFVPVRHIQRSRNGKPRVDAETNLVRGCPAHDLRRLIVENGTPTPVEFHEQDALELSGRRIRWANFQRERRHGDGIGIVTRSGYDFRIRFDKPVTGPLAFGYGAHFGLGLFVPVES